MLAREGPDQLRLPPLELLPPRARKLEPIQRSPRSPHTVDLEHPAVPRDRPQLSHLGAHGEGRVERRVEHGRERLVGPLPGTRIRRERARPELGRRLDRAECRGRLGVGRRGRDVVEEARCVHAHDLAQGCERLAQGGRGRECGGRGLDEPEEGPTLGLERFEEGLVCVVGDPARATTQWGQ